MTREEYLKFHRGCCDKMVEITEKKNADYTGGSSDPFFNFTRVEAVGIASTEAGFLTRMYDKFARVTTFVKKGTLLVADETVEDTLLDLANYCILLAGYIRDKKRNPPVEWVSGTERRFPNSKVADHVEWKSCECPACEYKREVERYPHPKKEIGLGAAVKASAGR